MLIPPFLCLSLVDTAWQLSLSIGRPSSADAAALLGPPLAMFTPGGGRPQPPAWLGREWAGSGSRLSFPLTIDFFDEPLRQRTTPSRSVERRLGASSRGRSGSAPRRAASRGACSSSPASSARRVVHRPTGRRLLLCRRRSNHFGRRPSRRYAPLLLDAGVEE
mmetsp:Transcript_20964/g.66751  ORF Transcript_20964/g.66751 Transcript_20964/m.66751 type:complete len:163 (+) Transcript_20964:106-594(+)